MIVRDANGVEVAIAELAGESGSISVQLTALGMTIPLKADLEKKGEGLIAKIEIVPLGASLEAEVEPADISGMMAGMNKDVMQFALKSLMKRKK